MTDTTEVDITEPAEVLVEQHSIVVEVNVEGVDREVVEVERLSDPAQVVVEQIIHEVDIAALGERGNPGDQGAPGAPGPPGPRGPAGGASGVGNYTHVQNSPVNVWHIVHNLDAFPAGIKVLDSAGTEWEGDVAYIDNDTITISFSTAFSGVAYLS